jgi:hypothetical protein
MSFLSAFALEKSAQRLAAPGLVEHCATMTTEKVSRQLLNDEEESVRGSTSEKAEYRDLFSEMTDGHHRLADGTTVKIRGSSSMGDLQASSSMGDLHAVCQPLQSHLHPCWPVLLC